MNSRKLNDRKNNLCNHCGYEKNPVEAKLCQRCGKPLNIVPLIDKKETTTSKSTSVQDLLLTPWIVRSTFGLLFLFLSWLIFSLFITINKLNNSGNPEINASNESFSNITLSNSIRDVLNIPEGTFNYGGGNTFAALVAQGLHEAIAASHPNFKLRYTESKDGKSGGTKGVAMVLDGQLSFTLNGASLEDTDYKKAQERGFQLKQVPVALDALVFFTHSDITIPGLSIKQLQDIYKGKVINWKEVGGPNLPIILFARDPKAANILTLLLGEEVDQLSDKTRFVRDYTDAIRKVSVTPGSISFGASALIRNQQTIRPLAIAKGNSQEYVQPYVEDREKVNTVAIRNGSYPINRRMFIVFRLDGTIDQLAGEAYSKILLSKEGQQFVEKAGLVSIR
ncbi:PstS family phosphate ABC transporter substrate-binding protein [Scytonema sp. NUACC26]